MKLSTRMVIGWIALLIGGATVMFDFGFWCFLGALVLADLLRTRFKPSISPDVQRRRKWIILPLILLYLVLTIWAGVPEAATHPVNIAGGIGIAAIVAWLICDDIRVYRKLRQTRAA